MPSGLHTWSQTAASNANADSAINYSEGQSPSSINDSARALMAVLAKWRDDISGAITTGGTSTSYTVASYTTFSSLTLLNGQLIAFTPHTTNGATVVLNVDGLGAKPLRSAPSIELPAGTLIQGTPYVALYNSSDAVFYLQGFYGQVYQIPIGAGVDYWGTTAPNSSFVFPYGQAISRTTYSALFTLFGTTYGVGDGSTTFNIPDLRGRVVAGKGNMGGVDIGLLNATYFGASGTTLGATGGAQASTLVTANLPAYTPAGSVSNGAITISGGSQGRTVAGDANNNGGGGGAFSAMSGTALSLSASQGSSTFTGTAQGGSSTPVRTVQPTIVGNYILRVI